MHGLATKGQLVAAPDRSETTPARLERLIHQRKDGIMQITNFKAPYIAELPEIRLEGQLEEASVERGERAVRSCR